MVMDMKDAFINNSFLFIKKNKNLSHYEEIKIKYGLEVMYHTITKTTVVLLISFFLGILKENILISLFYIPLRSSSHGIHSRNNLVCWISSITIYGVVGTLCRYVSIPTYSFLLIYGLCLLSFILWSPSDTKGRPLIHKKDRIRLKIISVIIVLSYLPLALFIKNIKSIILFALIIETININPFIYFITRTPRNNYKKFK